MICYRCKATPCACEDHATILHADNVAAMCEMAPDTIDLVVTSPPYDNLRTYGGHDWDFDAVAEQLWRIVKPGGVVVWIVADATIDGSETGTSFRQALRFKEIGFRLHDTMIWEKVDAAPGDGKWRYHNAFEYMFVLAKGAPNARNMIRDVPSSSAGNVDRKTWDRRGGKPRGGKERTPWVRPAVALRRNIWRTTHGGTQRDSVAIDHSAAFPEALVRDHIRSWSNEGDLVLDPFAGSFTTGKMARELGRRFVGIEVNEEYCRIGVNRLRQKVLF